MSIRSPSLGSSVAAVYFVDKLDHWWPSPHMDQPWNHAFPRCTWNMRPLGLDNVFVQIENQSVVFHDFTSLQQVDIMLSFLLSLDLQVINDGINTGNSPKELVYMLENMFPTHPMPKGSLRNQYLPNGVLNLVKYELNSSRTTSQYLLLLKYLPAPRVNRMSLFNAQNYFGDMIQQLRFLGSKQILSDLSDMTI